MERARQTSVVDAPHTHTHARTHARTQRERERKRGNSITSGQTLRSVGSDLVLYRLLMSHKINVRLIWVRNGLSVVIKTLFELVSNKTYKSACASSMTRISLFIHAV